MRRAAGLSLTLHSLDAVLLIGGDFTRQRRAGVEAEMCDGGEGYPPGEYRLDEFGFGSGH